MSKPTPRAMADIDPEDFKEIQEFHQKNYSQSPQHDTLLDRVQQAYPILEEVAANRETIYYSDLRDQINTGRGYPAMVIGTISHLEIEEGRPPLSVVVVQKETERPADDFTNLFNELDTENPHPGLSEEDLIDQLMEDVYQEHA